MVENENINLINELHQYISRLIDVIPNICIHIKSGENLFHLGDFFEGIEYILCVLNHTFFMHGISLNEDDIKLYLSDMINSTENKDYHFISDILQYEFLPIFINLNEKLFKYINNL